MAADDEGKLLPTPQTVNRKSSQAAKHGALTLFEQERPAAGEDRRNLWETVGQMAAEGDMSVASAESEVLTSPSKPSSGTNPPPLSSGTSPASESFPDIGPESPSSETSPGSEPLLLPTPSAEKHSPQRRADFTPNLTFRVQEVAAQNPPLLPTPAVNDMGAGKTVEWWDEWAARQKAADGRPAPHGKSLSIEAQRIAMEPEVPLIPTPTVQQGRNRTSGGQEGSQHHDGVTLNDWVWEITGRASILSAEAFPARTSPTPGSGRGSRATAQASSTSSLELSLNWNPDTCSWRTSEDSSPQSALIPTNEERPWPRSRERWPTSGSLVLNGSCWVLRMWAPPTDASASSSSLPTPRAARGVSTTETSTAITGVLPTPTTRDWKDSPGMSLESTNPDGSRRDRTDLLPRRVYGLLPTPRTTDSNGAGRHGDGGPDLRTQVTSLSFDGEPTNPPSEDGNE